MVSDVAEHIRLKKQMALVWDASQLCIEMVFFISALLKKAKQKMLALVQRGCTIIIMFFLKLYEDSTNFISMKSLVKRLVLFDLKMTGWSQSWN